MQPLSESNKLLFNEQVRDHIEKLNGLMTLVSGTAIEAGSIRKTCLATKLLEGSTSMLGIEAWSGTLTMFRELLDLSSRSSRCWDEQLSQIVSEVLETEEQVITEVLERDAAEVDFSGSFEGLRREIEFLLSECEKGMPPDGAETEVGIQDEGVQLDAECDRSLSGYYSESFSTLEVSPRERIDFWREMVRRHFVPLEIEPLCDDEFNGCLLYTSPSPRDRS